MGDAGGWWTFVRCSGRRLVDGSGVSAISLVQIDLLIQLDLKYYKNMLYVT